jgi:CHAT domain-containing protein/Flp pilus assembly protein TadD
VEGRIAEAAKLAQKEYAWLKSKQDSIWRWHFALLLAELSVYRGDWGSANSFLADRPPAQFASLIPRHEMLLGYSLSHTERAVEGDRLLNRAPLDARRLGDVEAETDAWLYLGMSLRARDPIAADLDFQRAERLAKANHLEFQQAGALSDRGLIQNDRERYADAIPLLEAARQVADHAGARLVSVLAQNNLANCYQGLGDLDQALKFQESSVQQQEAFGLEAVLSLGYSDLGFIHLRKGELSEAVRYFRLAFNIVGKDARFEYSVAAGNLAEALLRSHSLEEAEHFSRIAFEFADQGDKATIASLTSTQAAIAERRGQHGQAILTYQSAIDIGKGFPSVLWEAYAGLAGVYAAKNDFSNADASYTKALAVIDANRTDQLITDYKITFLSNLMRFYQDYVALLMRHGDTNRALEIADSSRASVLTQDLLGQSTVTALLPQIQKAAKASRSVFLFYWLAPKDSYVWVITGTQSKAVPLGDQRQIAQDVTSYRDLIERQKRDPLASGSQAGARLYQQLVGPVASLIPPGSRVVIVPDGVLHNLNFETLLVSSPQPHYWIEDVTVSIAPSLSILRPGSSASAGNRSLLLMGDPITQGTGFAPLPEAALEIQKVQRQFPAARSTLLTGQHAVVEAYSAAKPQNFSTIHFATHVDANAQSPLDSAIILSPHSNGFRLSARDVARTPLNAELVTISACRGAGARALSGEGLVGFAWAFFQARAQNVVTSLWDVYDSSTADLMSDFYGSVTGGRTYADALRQAKLKMLHSTYKRPYYWAPFQLYSRSIAAARLH